MSIDTTKSFADINEGTQVQVQVGDSTYDPEGRFGPAVELALDVEKPSAHAGDTILSTFSLSQPRLSKVRDLRADGLDDESIRKVLEKKNFKFENIDDPETPKLGGALLRIVKACYNNDARAVKKLLAECGSFHDLADALIGKSFVATTRVDKNNYTRIDGKAEFYQVMSFPHEVIDHEVDDLASKQRTAATAKDVVRESSPGDAFGDLVHKQRAAAAAKDAENEVDESVFDDLPF